MPRYVRPASSAMTEGISMLAMMKRGPMILGRICTSRMRPGEEPSERTARMYSELFTESVAVRMSRA